MYAGTNEGIYRSTDAGTTWNEFSVFFRGVPVTCLAVDPDNPRIIFAGTSKGIYRTGNAGQSWRKLRVGFGNFPVSSLTIDPNHQNCLYAGTSGGGVYRYVQHIEF